jgi:hypothetical protein
MTPKKMPMTPKSAEGRNNVLQGLNYATAQWRSSKQIKNCCSAVFGVIGFSFGVIAN